MSDTERPSPTPDRHHVAESSSPGRGLGPAWSHMVSAVFVGGLALVTVCYLLYKLRQAILIFAAGYFVAYLFEPLIKLLHRGGLSRGKAVWLVFVAMMVVVALVGVVLLPMLVGQAQDAARNWPTYSERAEQAYSLWRGHAEAWLSERYPGTNIPALLDKRIEYASVWLGARVPAVLQWLSRQLVTSLSLLGLALIVAIISFQFMMLKGRVDAAIMRLVPGEHTDEVSEVSHEIGFMLGNYVRGMVVLAALLGATTWTVMGIIGLVSGSKYALTVGVIACFAPFVPYAGSLATMSSAGFLTYMTATRGAQWSAVAAVIAVLAVDQIFDLIIRPRLIGRRIDLHPILALFSVFAGYSLFGFTGIIIGMPLAASIKITLAKWVPVIGSGPGVRAPQEPLLLDIAQATTAVWVRLRRLGTRAVEGGKDILETEEGP